MKAFKLSLLALAALPTIASANSHCEGLVTNLYTEAYKSHASFVSNLEIDFVETATGNSIEIGEKGSGHKAKGTVDNTGKFSVVDSTDDSSDTESLVGTLKEMNDSDGKAGYLVLDGRYGRIRRKENGRRSFEVISNTRGIFSCQLK